MEIADKLNTEFSVVDKNDIKIEKNSFLKKKIETNIRNRIGEETFLIFEENIIKIFNKSNGNFILIKFPKKYLISETPIILFLWIISVSLLLSLIAFLFLRIQIRAIQRLAKSAEEFGEGKNLKKFKPEGAMEIRQAGATFMKMRRRINNYISQRTNFLTGISHDLGTILTRIKLGLELISNQKETIQIKNDIKTMEMFLKEYLDYSEKTKKKKFSKINILNLLYEVINSSKLLKKKTNIVCNPKIYFNTNKNYLYRIIFNLLENASKYGKKINIRVKKKLKSLSIEIEDDGPGIPDSEKSNIFKPFFKIDDSRNMNNEGSGLGLSIANELVKTLQGEIVLKDSKTKGSIFSIILIET
jgi:two-component system osmolarity sensor histidine kinase EnvZ